MSWEKIKIQRENGEMTDAFAPVIVSASRSTDIPAFYAEEYLNLMTESGLFGHLPIDWVMVKSLHR